MSRQLPQWTRLNALVAVSIPAFSQHRDSYTEGTVGHLLCYRQSTHCTAWITGSQCGVWLRRPWYFTASVACQIWSLWNSSWLDCIIPVWSVTAGTEQGTSVGRVAAAVWCPAGISSRSQLVPSVYSWTVWPHRRMRFHMPHVRWWHTGLPQHASLWPRRRDGMPG